MLFSVLKLFLFFMWRTDHFSTKTTFFSAAAKPLKQAFLLLVVFVFSFKTNAQQTDSIRISTDSTISAKPTTTPLLYEPIYDGYGGIITPEQKKKRVRAVAIINIAGYSGAMIGLYSAWYKDYPQGKFHFFNDNAEWKGVDKMGHVYSAYAESKASMELWKWTGIDRKKRILLGGFSGAIYQTTIEALDGFSKEWGWSWGDFGANIIGSGMLVAQEFAWDEQRIQYKWSFHRKRYNDPALNKRSDDIFGKSSPERFLKDYNGQTYWLSTTLKPFFPKSPIPDWLQVSVGTGIEGVFGARSNIAKDDQGNITFDGSNIARRRQWYLAPDVDLTRIKTKKKGIKLALTLLNIIKFPTPSLEYSRGKFSVNFITF